LQIGLEDLFGSRPLLAFEGLHVGNEIGANDESSQNTETLG
jgi:hypothetical protein